MNIEIICCFLAITKKNNSMYIPSKPPEDIYFYLY